MPTNLLTTSAAYNTEKKVFFKMGDGYTRGGTYDVAEMTADALGRKILKVGSVLVRHTAGKVRALRRSKVLAAVSNGTSLSVSNPEVYTVGNVLTVLAPAGRVQLGGTYANADTVTITLDGVAIVHTVSNYSTLTALAEAVIATLNANAYFASKAIALAENGYVHIYAKDMVSPYTFAAAKSSTSGTVTVLNSATALVPGFAIGTISAIDVDNGTITLSSGSSSRLPIGMPIGAAFALTASKVLGFTYYSADLLKDSDDVVACSDGLLNAAAVPYLDDQIIGFLPDISLA